MNSRRRRRPGWSGTDAVYQLLAWLAILSVLVIAIALAIVGLLELVR